MGCRMYPTLNYEFGGMIMKTIIKDFRYIYDMNQANFYLQQGQVPVECGTSTKNNVYIKFKDSEELQRIFHKWMDRKYN